MKHKIFIIPAITAIFFTCSALNTIAQKAGHFNIEKDLLLVQYDCKTDVDDLQAAAAFATLMSVPEFSNIRWHVVAGTYGTQEGLYVPPNNLFQLAFADNWTDAHNRLKEAVKKVKGIVKSTLVNQGDVWIAEAGQSDFSAELVKAIQPDLSDVKTAQRIHIVQHSNWNEEVTSPSSLDFVKKNTDYHKIPDGNTVGNGTPGFRSPGYSGWKNNMKNPKLIEIWQLAIELSNMYNGKEGRYNNEAIAAGGLDFSDLSEVCWILGLEDIKDTEEFFAQVALVNRDTVETIQGFKNIYRYQNFYLGGQPSYEALEWLKSIGVSTIINLRSAKENQDFTASSFNEESVAAQMGFTYYSLPVDGIKDYTPLKLEEMAGLLMDEKPVFIHCAGAGRVTYFFMAYLIKYRDYRIDEAIEIGKKLTFSLPLENLLDSKITMKVAETRN